MHLSNSVALTLILFASLVNAQDGPAPNAVELAAHRALQRVTAQNDAALEPFTTDGCSGGISATWRVVADQFPDFAEAHGGIPPWEECCTTHDIAYHAGGAEESAHDGFAARAAADDRLRQCVFASGIDEAAALAVRYGTTEEAVRQAYRTIGEAMYVAVRIGGGPCSGLSWRWGYGRTQCITRPTDFRADED